MPKEQRRHKRYEVQDVRGSLAQNIEAELLNMSLTGMAVSARSIFKVGGKCRLQVVQGKHRLVLPAEVKWCRLVQTERTASGEVVPVYHAGLDFREALEGQARELLEVMESSIVVELDRRLAGRFEVTVEEPVEVRTSYPFEVRKISLSGMTIETQFVPDLGMVLDFEIHPDGSLIEARGRIAHVQELREGAALSRLGVEFQKLSAEARRGLEALIESQIE